MSSDFLNDILQPVSDDELLTFYEITKQNLPAFLRAHHFLLMQYKWKKFLKLPENHHLEDSMSARCKYNFFKHRNGDIKKCTFVAITVEGKDRYLDDYTVFISSMQNGNAELEECLRNTKRINWKLTPLFLATEEQDLPLLRTLANENNYSIIWDKQSESLWLPKEEAKNFEYEIPTDLYISGIKLTDADLIDSKWLIQSPGTIHHVRSQIILNGGLGLYKKDTNQLVPWVLINENYGPGLLATVDSERGKGYAKLILKAFCKIFAEKENLDLVGFVLNINVVSRRVFASVGFRKYGECSWFKLQSV